MKEINKRAKIYSKEQQMLLELNLYFHLMMMILDNLQHLLYNNKLNLFRIVYLKKILTLPINQVDNSRIKINKLLLLSYSFKINKIKIKLIHNQSLNLILLIKVSETKRNEFI